MDWLRKLTIAFASGCVGVIGFYIAFRLAIEVGIIKGPPPVMEFLAGKGFLYKQIVWGGVWGFLFVIPVLTGLWWARGLIVGFLATLAALFIFRSGTPPIELVITGLVLNMVFWGLLAAWWHDKVMTKS